MGNRLKMAALAILVMLGATACPYLETKIRTEPIKENIDFVIERHDMYVLFDAKLPEDQASAAIKQSQGGRALLGQDQIAPEDFQAVFEPVFDRHDAYVKADEGLTGMAERVYLRSTAQLRELFP